MPYDQIRATPQNATLGAIARALQGTHEFVSKPFGYDNPPAAFISETLGIPALGRTVERLSYGEPITNLRKANVPLLPDDTADAAMTVAPMVSPLARVAGKGAKAGAKVVGQELNRAILDSSGSLAALVPQAAKPLYAVKPKGGNWLAGSIENAVQPMKAQGLPDLTGTGPLPLEPHDAAVNRWLDTKLAKYMRNEMGTPEDPIRALAERGVLHYDPRRLGIQSAEDLRQVREMEGFPASGLGQSDLAQRWEGASDLAVYPNRAGYVAKTRDAEANPWLAKVDPETSVYEIGPRDLEFQGLGFNHLVDELKFSMDPTSGLPDHLRFDPKNIDKLTVPQAVERVSKINAWRAEQAAQAERAGMLDNLKAEPRLPDEGLQLSFVDKPGGAWVDIPDTVGENGMPICNSIGKAGGWCTQHEWAATSYGSGPNRLTALVDAEGRPHAQAKITSDLDEQGAFESAINGMTPEQEAAYMEWADHLDSPPELSDALEWMRDNEPSLFKDYKDTLRSQVNGPPSVTELKPVGNSFDSDRAREYMKRDPQYKQKVTESVLKFLNSGEWGKVKDLQHYDIVDLQDPTSVFRGLNKTGQSNREIAAYFNDLLDSEPDLPRFMTRKQLTDLVKDLKGSLDADEVPGYAGGGLVKGAVKGLGEMVEKYLAKETPAAVAEATYYRGIPRVAESNLDSLSGLQARERRFTGATQGTLGNTRGYAWASDNPLVAETYSHRGGVMVPLQATEPPGVVFDARGMPWHEFFYPGAPNAARSDYAEALKDPAIRSILVKNVVDPGGGVTDEKFLRRLYEKVSGQAAAPGSKGWDQIQNLDPDAYLRGNNLLIKDPSIMRYKLSGEKAGFAQGGFVDGGQTDQDGVNSMVDEEKAMGGAVGYAAGGLVNYDPNEIDTIVSRLKEEIYA